MSRARHVLMTGFWSMALHVVSIASQILVVPFFLKAWSQGTYDDWIALTALVSVLQYADGGMQAHVINRLTLHATQERWKELQEEIASATLMYLLATAIALAGAAGMCLWLWWSGHFRGRPLEHQAVAIAALLGTQVAVQLLLGLINGIYRAFGRADQTSLTVFILRTLLLAGTLAVLISGHGALAIAAMQLGLFVSMTCLVFIDTRRRYPRAALTLRGARLRSAIKLLGPSLMFLFVSLAGGLTQSGTLLVIDAIIPTALVQFATTRTVAGSVRQILAVFTNSAWPELTRIDAQGNKERFALAHRVLVKVTSTVILPVAATLLFCGVNLYVMWTRGRAQANPRLLRLLLIDVLATVPWNCSSYILAATSRIRTLSYVYLFTGIAHVILCIVAVRLWGVWAIGAVMVTLTLAVYGQFVPRWALKVVNESWRSYVTGIYLPYALLCGATVAVTWRVDACFQWLLAQPGTSNWLQPLAVGALHLAGVQSIIRSLGDGIVSLAFALLLSWWLLFRAAERDFLKSTITSILRRRKAAGVQPGLSA